jgi:hypothetical protein
VTDPRRVQLGFRRGAPPAARGSRRVVVTFTDLSPDLALTLSSAPLLVAIECGAKIA